MTDTVIEQQPVDETPRAPIEWRRAGPVEVNFVERIAEFVVVPWNVEASVEYPPKSGRSVIESVLPGAFDGVEKRANRVKANRDHNYERTIGRAVALHPSRSEGLVAEVRISRTPLGDETLALLDDRALEASAGMAVAPSWHQLLDNRRRRHIHKAFLDHIAFVPEGAYGSPDQILDVRTNPPATEYFATPNIDSVMAWMRERGA